MKAAAAVATAVVTAGLASPAPTASAGTEPALGGCQAFPAYAGPAGAPSAGDQTAWNQDVSATPKDPRSAKYMKRIRRLGGNQSLHPDFGGDGEYGIPYEIVAATQPEVEVTAVEYGDESDFGLAPIPPGAGVEGGSDHHAIVVRQGSPCELFELYRARFLGAGSETPGRRIRPRIGTSARRRCDRRAGPRPTPPACRSSPAWCDPTRSPRGRSTTRSARPSTRPGVPTSIPPPTTPPRRCARSLPPMGLRLRLRRGYYERHLADFAPGSQARPIFEALYRYGVVVADNGSNWYLTGAADPAWDDDDVGDLKGVPGSAFLVVDLGGAGDDALLTRPSRWSPPAGAR